MGVSGDLNPWVTFDVVDKPVCVKCVIDHPLSILGKLINFNLEKQDLAAAPDDKSLLVNQVHVSEILVVDLLLVAIIFIFVLVMLFVWLSLRFFYGNRILDDLINHDRDSKWLALSVEWINLIVVTIIVAFLWKVLLIAFELNLFVIMDLLVPESWQPVAILVLVLKWVEEVMVGQRGVVEQVHEQ